MGTSYLDRLEGGYQLLKIRRIRAWAFAALIMAASALVAFSLAAGGASAKPLYMPLSAFLPVLLILFLVGVVLWMFFRNLEVRYAKKDGQRYLMVKGAMNRAMWTIIVGAVLAIVLLIPATQAAINDSLSVPAETRVLQANADLVPPLKFENQDFLGLTRCRFVIVAVTAAPNPGSALTVTVYKNGVREGAPRAITRGNSVPFAIDTSGLYEYILEFHNSSPGAITFTYSVQRDIMPDLFVVVPAVAIVLVIASALYFVYLRPQREKYEKASIYSAEYRARVDEGERLYTEYQLTRAVPGGPSEATRVAASEPATPPSSLPPFPVPEPAVAHPVTPPAPLPPEVPPPSIAVEAPPPSAADAFAEGASLFSQGQYEEAIARFDDVLRQEPRMTRALLAKGNALLRIGQSEEALRSFDEVLSFDRGNLDALLGTAGVYAAQHRWRDVVDLADTYLMIRPGDPDMLTQRGDALLALGKRPDAQISYEAALLKRPGDPVLVGKIESTKVDIASLQSKALIASASGNLEQAMALFEEILKLEPDNANALVGKSVSLRRAGRVDDALACLDQVLVRQPGHGGALLNKGRILEERGDLDDALEAYDKLIELSPGDPDAWVAQGDVLAKMTREEDAVKSYNEALKISPSDEDTRAKIKELEKAREVETELLQELFQIRGIGPAKARALRDAGFRNREDFKKATEEALLKVHGVSRRLAADIMSHFQPGKTADAQP